MLSRGQAVKDLRRAVDRVGDLEQVTVGTAPLEHTLAEIVEIIGNHPDDLDELKAEFIRLARELPPGATEILEFSMHQYPWAEVEAEITELFAASTDIRAQAVYRRVLAAFDPDWEDRDIYQAYRN